MKANINGLIFELEPDENGYYWTSFIPTCTCGEPLTRFCEEPKSAEFPAGCREASVHSEWHDTHHVECDNCGEYWPIDGVAKLPNRLKAQRPAEGFEDVSADGCSEAKEE